MALRRRKKKPAVPKPAQRRIPGWASSLTKPLVYALLAAVGLSGATAGGVWGVRRMEASLRLRPEFQRVPVVAFENVPNALREPLRAAIQPLIDAAPFDPALCRKVTETLQADPWIARVRHVRRYADGVLQVSVDCRTPLAMIQQHNDFYLISDDGVRLPGRYSYKPSFVVVQGVAGEAPEPGQSWTDPEVQAALGIIKRLSDTPFFEQITGVIVENYAGRRDKRQSHVQLATSPGGGRIDWGSAPGQEVEENTVEQKVHLLLENYRRWGRVDAGHAKIDISTFPDRFTVRTSA